MNGLTRPTVYVLTQINEDDQEKILGVFASPDPAKRAAEEHEPGSDFHWRQDSKGVYALRSTRGPDFDYIIDPSEVIP